MGQIEKLLKYQEADEQLLKIERETSNSEERKNFLQAKAYLENAPQKFESLDAKAHEMHELLEKLEKKYADIAETLGDFDNIDELIEEGADISFYKKSLAQITEKLKSIKAEINALKKSITEADEEYKVRKKKYINVNNQAVEYQKAYKAYKQTKSEEMEKVKTGLTKLAKDIDPAVMKSYEIKRSERIFPILCEVKDGRCSKCGAELSLAGKAKVDGGALTECDNCHRFLYKN